MTGKSRILKSLSVGRNFPRWRMIIMMTTLALIFGSPGHPMAVLAAPSSATIIYRMKVILPPDPICADHDYPVKVRISADEQYSDNKGLHDLVSEGVSGITVETFVADESIATITPPQLMTGWDVDNDAPGEGTFNLHTKEAGTTTLFFEAYVKQAAANNQEPYFGSKTSINIVDCEYKVRISYSIAQFSHGTSSNMFGYLDTVLKKDGEVYIGEGAVANARRSVIPGCSFSHSGFISPTSIKGAIVDGKLLLVISYQPGQYTAVVECPFLGSAPSATEDISLWMPTTADFPQTGGVSDKQFHSVTRGSRLNFAYWLGWSTITVTPVAASAP